MSTYINGLLKYDLYLLAIIIAQFCSAYLYILLSIIVYLLPIQLIIIPVLYLIVT